MKGIKLISNLDDIRALETKPWEEVAPAKSTYELLSSAAAKWQDKTAITFLPTGAIDEEPIRITYRQLIGRIRQAANMFRDLGAGPQDTISLWFFNSYLLLPEFWCKIQVVISITRGENR